MNTEIEGQEQIPGLSEGKHRGVPKTLYYE